MQDWPKRCEPVYPLCHLHPKVNGRLHSVSSNAAIAEYMPGLLTVLMMESVAAFVVGEQPVVFIW